MSNKNKLYSSPKNKTSEGFLSALWRKILVDNGLVEKIPGLLARYSHQANNSETLKNLTTVKRDVFSENMTIKSFVYLLKNVLQPKKLKFTVSVTWANGKETHHTQEIKMDESD